MTIVSTVAKLTRRIIAVIQAKVAPWAITLLLINGPRVPDSPKVSFSIVFGP